MTLQINSQNQNIQTSPEDWVQEWTSRPCQPYCFTPWGPSNWQLRERARLKGGHGLTKQEHDAYFNPPKFLQYFR